MALMNCPECGRKNISEDKESCPFCGFNIMKYNKQAEKEQKKSVKKGLIKKIIFSFLGVVIIVAAMSIVSAHKKIKLFQSEVDKFVAYWDEMIEATNETPPNRLAEDLCNKMLVATMDNISEKYVGFKDKAKVNEYLEDHTWKEMFERVMEYNKSYDDRKIEQDFINFYMNME